MDHRVVVFDSFYVSQEWAEELEATIHYTLDTLLAQLEGETENGDEDGSVGEMEPPSGQPFCGCETCVRREIMVLTIAATLEAVQQGLAEPHRLAS